MGFGSDGRFKKYSLSVRHQEVMESVIEEGYRINHLQLLKAWKGFGSEDHLKQYDDVVEVLESESIKDAYDIDHLQFKKAWKGVGSDGHLKKYSLAISTLQEAVDAVVGLVSLPTAGNSNVMEDGAESHVINMAGRFIGGILILSRALLLIGGNWTVVGE